MPSFLNTDRPGLATVKKYSRYHDIAYSPQGSVASVVVLEIWSNFRST